MSLSKPLSKRIIHSFVSVCAVLSLASAAAAADFVCTKKDNVNIRSRASSDAPVAMEIFSGYPLKVEKKEGDWLKVSDYENDGGWIHSSMVNKNTNVIVSAKKSAKMRMNPDPKSPVIADLDRGVVLTVVSTKGKWKQLKHSAGTVGWMEDSNFWPQQ